MQIVGQLHESKYLKVDVWNLFLI